MFTIVTYELLYCVPAPIFIRLCMIKLFCVHQWNFLWEEQKNIFFFISSELSFKRFFCSNSFVSSQLKLWFSFFLVDERKNTNNNKQLEHKVAFWRLLIGTILIFECELRTVWTYECVCLCSAGAEAKVFRVLFSLPFAIWFCNSLSCALRKKYVDWNMFMFQMVHLFTLPISRIQMCSHTTKLKNSKLCCACNKISNVRY